MAWKQKVQGSVLGFIGFMLSPLSWWNDAFVNLPLAVAFAWSVTFFYRPAFEAALIIGYWLTNVLGFVLMQFGSRKIITNGPGKSYSRRDFFKDVVISMIYTGIIVLLLHWKILQPISNYFTQKR